ncbi:MAG TPA: ATP-binding protein [Geobacteraceae bacterium]|nr:ATP-binding protein [Geobacteraceae bacterium]
MNEMNAVPSTYFAPAGRSPGKVLGLLRGKILVERLLAPMLDAIPDCTLILNRERQILAANGRMLELSGLAESELIGRRPGEALNCIHANDGPDGCTTGVHCSTCGAVLAILQSQEQNRRAEGECRITFGAGGMSCIDLHVTASPVVIAEVPLTVCVLKDISAEKRRGVLERVFFHDMLNTVTGISGLTALLAANERLTAEEDEEYRNWLVDLSERLIEEIKHQRKLLAAEKGDFTPESGCVPVMDLMRGVHRLYANHSVAQDRNIVLGEVPDISIVSDGSILRRILGNLVKNALEAVAPGETVTICCEITDDKITFYVHNPGVMPLEVQLQLFQRSFSTKAAEGRGIGTYSAKLFGERYLKGKLAFSSSEAEGTIFSLSLPLSMPDRTR